MMYKGIEIRRRVTGKHELNSPINGTLRLFRTEEQAKNYIDNARALDASARAMAKNPW